MNVYEKGNINKILANNEYPGRGIIIGVSQNGENTVFAYFIMGRSENSRNRVFVKSGNELVIHPFDVSKVSDPSLIIYSPVRVCGGDYIVTNGDQTDTVYEYLKKGMTFEQALETRCFEPDAPNFTPRISGIIYGGDEVKYKLSILKSADEKGSACNRFCYSYSGIDGVGHFIHTYMCDGSPIPTFCTEPERISIDNDIKEFTDAIWDNLNEDYKISLYTCFINRKSGKTTDILINKNK